MKKHLVLSLLVLASVALFLEKAGAQSRPLFFPSSQLPPPNGMFLAPPQLSATTPNGIVISNLTFRRFTRSIPAPPPGTSATLQFAAQMDFDLKSPGGGIFNHVSVPVKITANMRGQPDSGNQHIYDTEMLQLDITGNLPGGLMIRESPTLPSTGQVMLNPQPLPPGSGMISSFFDIFTELSTDGGQSWMPLDPPQHVELRVDPIIIRNEADNFPVKIPIPVPEPTPLFPPPDDQLQMRTGDVAMFAGGVRIRGLRQTMFSQATDASQIGFGPNNTILPFIESVDFHLSMDGGQTYTPVRASGNLAVSLSRLRATPEHFFDTEMLQLDLTGNFPGGAVMIRESPTLPSFGGAIITPAGGGTFEVSSFFDVFVELSTDGGQTWLPASNGPLHLEGQGNSPRDRYTSSNLPTPNGRYVWPAGMMQTYPVGGGSVVVNGGTLAGFSASGPPPPPGQALIQNFISQMNLKLSLNGGVTFTDVTATATGAIQVRRNNLGGGGADYYDTEMLQLSLTGLPQGVMIRESPTRASTGRTSITPDAGLYRIDSFFDIFTELSVDGGQSWHPAVEGPASSALRPVPIEAPLRILCPSDISVFATGSTGAVVNFLTTFLAGDCPLLPFATVTCTPPSGSVFPIGTTTVTCEAHNGCGEHVSCTFHVTVHPKLPHIPDYVFKRALWPPPGGLFLAPAEFRPISAGGILFRNLTLRNFLRDTTPPAPGTSLTLDAPLTVELDWSLDGGATFTHGSAPAKILIGLLNMGQVSGQEIHEMEIHRLAISGGNLPGGLMIRESPTLPSLGQTGARIIPNEGGVIMDSFFDIFFEVSTDGGQTWQPAGESGHVELRSDGGSLPQVPEFAPLSPPPDDQFASPPEALAMFNGGVRLKNLHHKLFSQAFDATLLDVSTVPVVQQFDASLYLQWSLDGGATFTGGRAPAMVTVAVQKVREAANHTFDTELLQLDLHGGDLPSGVMIRESPTLPSHGQMHLEPLADGTFTMSSFFDVFFEVSADGGQTWVPAISGPLRLEQQGNSPRSRFTSPDQPPAGGSYQWPDGVQLSYLWGTKGQLIAGFTITFFQGSAPPPRPGETQTQTLQGQAELQVSTDGGQTFNRHSAPASAQMRITGNAGITGADRQYFDTEMLQLNITGGNLPGGMMIRESPTRASLGRTSLRLDGPNAYRMDSFFDIFTELSLDGGQNWVTPPDGSATTGLRPPPPFAPYVITCPSNITVYAFSPGGAVVNYMFPPMIIFPDCPFCCFAVTSAPPSGTLFPIGTTTVTGYGHDGCGENPTCTFTVTVLQPFIYAGLVESILGSAVLKIDHSSPSAPASLIVSNLGPAGLDGFHVNLGLADSAVLNFQPFPTTVNTCIVTRATGPYALDPNHLLGVATYFGGSNPVVRADFSSLGSTSVLAQVRDENHHLVLGTTLANNQWLDVNALFPPDCTNRNTTVYTYWQGPDFAWYRFCRYGCNCIGTNCYVERVVCLRADLARALRPLSLSGLDLFGQGASVPASLTIQSLDIGMFGNLHQPRGDATLETDSHYLAVNNIGVSGDDGVVVNLKNVGRFDMTLAPTRLQAQGACFNLTALGEVNGVPALQIGMLSLTQPGALGGPLHVQAGFAGLGATQMRVAVFQDSQFQGGVILPVGTAGDLTLNGNLIGAGTLSQPTAGFRLRFDSPFQFAAPGNQNFAGNELRVIAVSHSARARGLSQFDVRACGLGQFAILDEAVTPLIGNVARAIGGGVFLTGQGSPGQTYRLEAIPDFDPQSKWMTVGSAEADIDGTFDLSDMPVASQQFYRVVTP